MFGDNTDKSWEAPGQTDPYFGVWTHERFRAGKLDDQVRQEFFASGKDHMSSLMHRVESLLGPIHRGKALEFGCGVGRLAIPLAERCGFQAVIGVDVSESMLREARSNAHPRFGMDNFDFMLSDDSLSRLSGDYDLVHSFIVLQHIPIERGMGFRTPAFAGAVEQFADFGVVDVLMFGFFSASSFVTAAPSHLIFRRPGFRFDQVTLAPVLLLVQYIPSFGLFLLGSLYAPLLLLVLAETGLVRVRRWRLRRSAQAPFASTP